jgi:hypothetical protein
MNMKEMKIKMETAMKMDGTAMTLTMVLQFMQIDRVLGDNIEKSKLLL